MKKALLYSPYLDSLGGGERYMLTVASLLTKNNIQVDFLWNGSSEIIKKAANNFDLDLKNVKFIKKSLSSLNLLQKYLLMRSYDFSFILSDGSIPFLFSKINYLHVQVPFNFTNQINLVNKVKLYFIKSLICNSKYTQKWIQKTYHTLKTQVLYPPVKITKHKNKLKNKFQILSVSRFNNNLNSKRQDILIKAFKLLHKKDNKYSLILAGSSPVANSLINILKEQAKGLPVKFALNPNSRKLNKLYADSGLFWHAAGYGVDENIQPEKTEHFGMVLVEALSYRCQVFAVDKGGAREIIDNGTNGYLYTKLHDLVKKTLAIANKPVNLDLTIQKFSVTNFEIALMNLFS